MILFRAGNVADDNLKEGNWWSNSLKQIKPYFKGKVTIIEITLHEAKRKRYMLTKEIKKYGHHDGFGVWTRTFSNYSEDLDENYYYISPIYLKKYAKVLDEFEGLDALKEAKKKYNISI